MSLSPPPLCYASHLPTVQPGRPFLNPHPLPQPRASLTKTPQQTPPFNNSPRDPISQLSPQGAFPSSQPSAPTPAPSDPFFKPQLSKISASSPRAPFSTSPLRLNPSLQMTSPPEHFPLQTSIDLFSPLDRSRFVLMDPSNSNSCPLVY